MCGPFIESVFHFKLLLFSEACKIDFLARNLNIFLNRKLPRFENLNLVKIVTYVIDYLVEVADNLLKNKSRLSSTNGSFNYNHRILSFY